MPDGFRRVLQPVGEYVSHVLIGKTVVDQSTAFSACDDVAIPEEPQLMAQRGLADPEENREVADAQLVRHAQSVQDPRARGISEHPKRGRHPIGACIVQHTAEERRDMLRMHALHLTALGSENI